MKIQICLLLGLLLSLQMPIMAQRLRPLQTELENFVRLLPGKVGVAVIYDGKDTLRVNDAERYPMMSVFKFHQALAVADFLEREGRSLDSCIFVKKEEFDAETYSPLRDRYPDGKRNFSLRELLTYTLQLSDNNACDLLFNRVLPVSETEAYIRSQGTTDFMISATEKDMKDHPSQCYENWSSPLATAVLLEKLSRQHFPESHPLDFVKRALIGCSTGQGRLPVAWKNSPVVFGHKTGTGGRNAKGEIVGVNDVGFAYLPDGRRYVIVVYVMNWKGEVETAEEVIATLSRKVYEFLKPLKPSL